MAVWLLTYLKGGLKGMTEKPQSEKGPFTIVARVIRQEGHCGADHRMGDEVVFQSCLSSLLSDRNFLGKSLDALLQGKSSAGHSSF